MASTAIGKAINFVASLAILTALATRFKWSRTRHRLAWCPARRLGSRTAVRGSALRELVEQKVKGQKIIAPAESSPRGSGNVVDLMEALRRSVEGGGTKPKKAGAKKRAS